jgi:phage FluMu protein Com
MSPKGYMEYKAREFCNDVKCPVQETLNSLKAKTEAYELIRQTCRTACRYSTWQFHHWLIEKGYLIVKPKDKAER